MNKALSLTQWQRRGIVRDHTFRADSISEAGRPVRFIDSFIARYYRNVANGIGFTRLHRRGSWQAICLQGFIRCECYVVTPTVIIWKFLSKPEN